MTIKGLKRLWLPLAVVAFAGIQVFGIDAGRTLSLRRSADSLGNLLPTDSSVTVLKDSLPRLQDSVKGDLKDSLELQKDSLNVEIADSLETEEIINPADTIRIPDSLEFKDPFKFKYYIALRDSATRAYTRDTLLAAGDSLELARLDSLYIKDSTEIAKIAFDKWYKGLSRKERKRYDYEQKLPALLHRSDSIMHRQDSIKAYKDSVRENTPRILETFAFPDSLQYKRIVVWNVDQDFQQFKYQKQDTSFNYWFNDIPQLRNDVNVTWQGVSGSATQYYNYFKREEEDNAIFYTPYRDYSFSASTLPQYNTKTPYTELAYWGTLFAKDEKEEMNVRVWTSQNILPSLNLTLGFYKFGGKGMLQREDVTNSNAVVGLNYLGKKYMMHTGFVHNKITKSENGGVTDLSMIRDTTLDARELAVNLHNASNEIKKNTIFLDETFRIPFSFINKLKSKKDSTFTYSADTLDKNITSAYIGHSSTLDIYSKKYTDEINSSNPEAAQFYNNTFYLNPTSSADSLRTLRLDNKVFMRLQPWASDAALSKIDVGIGDKLASYYSFNPDVYISGKLKNTYLNSAYVYAGANGKIKRYVEWDATGRYTFAGYEVNDFRVDANMKFSFYPFRRDKYSPIDLKIHFETGLKEPDFYQQNLLTNHFRWNNDFNKTSTTKILGELDIPKWELAASFGYALLANNLYYDSKGIVQQNSGAMSVMTAYLQKNFTFWKIHLDNRALFQLSSNNDVLPLPMLALNLRWYIQFPVVRKVMEMQIGLNTYFTTAWNAPGYNPALGVWYNQTAQKYGNCPYYDAFVNIQWLKACIFVKFMNAGQGWPMQTNDYFTSHGNIYTQRAIKIGIYWPFYISSHKNGKASASGGSTVGGITGGARSNSGMSNAVQR